MYLDLYFCMILGFVTFALSVVIAVSQFYVTIKTKNTSGVSLWTYCIFMIAGWICLAWVLTYYFKVLTSRPPDDMGIDPSIIPAGKPQPYGPYWLWQWGILPLLSYYIFDVLMGFVLMSIKVRHMLLAKKLKMSEMDLSDYLLKEQKNKLVKSGYRLHNRKYFWFTITLISLLFVIVAFAGLWATFVTPQYNPEFYNHEKEWSYVWVLGLIGALAFEAISWPQFIKCLKEKNTSGISLNWAIFLPIGMLISFSYALTLALAPGGTKFPPDTLGALIFNGLIVNFGVLILKFKNMHDAKKHHMTEMEYTKKYLIPAYRKKLEASGKLLPKEERAKFKLKKLINKASLAQKNARQLNKEKLAELNA